MNDLILITDEAGNVLYHDRRITLGQAFHAVLDAATKEKKRGLVMVGARRAFIKEVSLEGKRHLFFLDFDRLYKRFGVAATRAADGLFDVESFSLQEKRQISLRTLFRLFTECYEEELGEKEGILLNLRVPRRDLIVNVPISVFTLCLSLLVHLTAGKDGEVTISFIEECGRITVFADGNGVSPLSAGEREILSHLLFEAGNAVGFAVNKQYQNGGCAFSLTVNPLDVALLGLKAEQFSRYRNTLRCYISMFH